MELQKNPTITEVVAAALVGPDGKVLMHRRPLYKQHGGLWEFPGGKVEHGETPGAALARELLEELGVAVDPAELLFVTSAADSAANLRIGLYLCRSWQGEPQCLEGEGIGWFEPQVLPTLAMPPLDVPLANALISAI